MALHSTETTTSPSAAAGPVTHKSTTPSASILLVTPQRSLSAAPLLITDSPALQVWMTEAGWPQSTTWGPSFVLGSEGETLREWTRRSQPPLMLADLPGVSARDKEHRLNKKLKPLVDIARQLQRQNAHVVFFGSSRNPAWQSDELQRFQQEPGFHEVRMAWCSLGVKGYSGKPHHREERLLTNLRLRSSFCVCKNGFPGWYDMS